MSPIKSVILVVLIANLACCYKVLLFFPFPGKSHTILSEGYVRHLVNAGHNVTYVTPIPVSYNAPNLRQIDVSSNFDNFFFDEVPAVFDCPLIWSSTMEPHPMVLRLIDEIPNPSYIPDHRSPTYPPLTFAERVAGLWNTLKLLYVRWSLSDLERKAYNEAYTPAFQKRGRELPSMDTVRYNASLMFGNSHVSSGMAMSLPQNFVQIAGYHIKTDVPPLPENLQKIMDNASEGVIYFSLGSMMKSKTMPAELKTGFLEIFSKLKQVVIWKLEEQLPNLPKNVHIVEWAPQQSILAHPKTVLFITHGGLLSTTETIHYGVPIIGIPLFSDQFLNIKRAVKRGYGKHVSLGYDAPEQLKAAIDEILGDPKYTKTIKELSLVYHDRPVSPADEIVHWVEHVVKTRGAPHLRSPALMMPWYQKLYLDLFALVLFTITVLVQIVKRWLTVINNYTGKVKCQ